MNSLAPVLLVSLILVALAVACTVLALRQRGDAPAGVQPSLELTPQDGWSLLNLVLKNRGDSKVWIERAAFVFTDLDADMQSVPPTGNGTLNIREFVSSHQALRVSLIEGVYNAAGKPQGVYEFRLVGAVRYRVGDLWMEVETPAYQVDMVRLSATRLRKVKASDAAASVGPGIAAARILLGPAADVTAQETLKPLGAAAEDLNSVPRSV